MDGATKQVVGSGVMGGGGAGFSRVHLKRALKQGTGALKILRQREQHVQRP